MTLEKALNVAIMNIATLQMELISTSDKHKTHELELEIAKHSGKLELIKELTGKT